MLKISKRLTKIANMVKHPCGSVVDIGTDHGLLAIYLVQQAIVKCALATDVNPGPLMRAAANIHDASLAEKIDTRLCNGLDGIHAGVHDACIIAGMGGGLIIKIISQNLEVAHSFKQLILSPQRDVPNVRRFLHANGFAIKDEAMVLENGKFYNILDCAPENEPAYENLGYIFGQRLLDKKDNVLAEFIKTETAKTAKIMGSIGDDNARWQELQVYKKHCEEAAKWL